MPVPSSHLALLPRSLCPQCCYTPSQDDQLQAGARRAACEDTVRIGTFGGLATWCTQTLHLSQKTISLPSSPSGERHTSQTTSSSYSMPSPSCVSMARAMFWWHSVSSSSSTRSRVSSSSAGLSVRTTWEGVRSVAFQGRWTEGLPFIWCDLGKQVGCRGPQLHCLKTEWAGPSDLKGPGACRGILTLDSLPATTHMKCTRR